MSARAAVPSVLLAVLVACQARDADPAPGESAAAAGAAVEDSVRALEQAWAEAIRTRDSTALDRLVAPDFALEAADSSAPSLPRAVWMANTMQRLRFDTLQASPAVVTVRGDTAVATLGVLSVGQFMTAPPFRDSAGVTDTWVRSAGAWRVQKRRVAAK